MSGSAMKDAFGHHVWATVRLIDVCIELPPEQLATAVPGTYGSILETQRHLVGSDTWYLLCITKDDAVAIDEDHMGLGELRTAIERNGARWSQLLADELDPDAIINDVDHEDGYQKDAPAGIRFAQVLHHGTDHRSQICTALTSLDVEPPPIDVWDFGVEVGRVVETFPPS
jgi:uncharacterized damage-inducible protein DinB